MMQYEYPDDWVLATGVTKILRDFAEETFKHVNLKWEDYVVTSKKYFRPNEVDYLLGDSSKGKKKLNWEPQWTFQVYKLK